MSAPSKKTTPKTMYIFSQDMVLFTEFRNLCMHVQFLSLKIKEKDIMDKIEFLSAHVCASAALDEYMKCTRGLGLLLISKIQFSICWDSKRTKAWSHVWLLCFNVQNQNLSRHVLFSPLNVKQKQTMNKTSSAALYVCVSAILSKNILCTPSLLLDSLKSNRTMPQPKPVWHS